MKTDKIDNQDHEKNRKTKKLCAIGIPPWKTSVREREHTSIYILYTDERNKKHLK